MKMFFYCTPLFYTPGVSKAMKAINIKALFTAGITFMTALWGWLGWALFLLLLAMVIDYITGSVAAKRKGEWTSAAARAGLWHKLGTVIAVGVAVFADLGVKVALMSDAMVPLLHGVEWPEGFTMVVTFWYLFTELGSILENAEKLGAPVHPWLIKGIDVLNASTTPAAKNQKPVSELDTK